MTAKLEGKGEVIKNRGLIPFKELATVATVILVVFGILFAIPFLGHMYGGQNGLIIGCSTDGVLLILSAYLGKYLNNKGRMRGETAEDGSLRNENTGEIIKSSEQY